ncbi:hypothetical protein C5167_039593 [Papaver somniferum]|uniref:Uncharacterized protein n=1 Tax=Papaver somniferum TaxID=3469 RepID=A0A4Y7IF21_PAPSO|nr:hypothetical protein C5167_039593 [Papaver somniferum]
MGRTDDPKRNKNRKPVNPSRARPNAQSDEDDELNNQRVETPFNPPEMTSIRCTSRGSALNSRDQSVGLRPKPRQWPFQSQFGHKRGWVDL